MSSSTKIQKVSRSTLAQAVLTLDGKPYSLKDYPHMILPYNIDPDEMVLHFSRQCVLDEQVLNLFNGKPIFAKDLKEGQYLASFDEETQTIHPGKVKNVWNNGIEPVYGIKTVTGRHIRVTDNHPIWTTVGWVRADDLKTRDLVGMSESNLKGDIVFDEVKEINYLGKLSTTAIEIEKYHTFLIDNIVTKNTSKSLTIAGRMLMDAISEKFLKQMYVSPTMDQTKVFSNDRLKPFIEGSSFITKHFVDPRLAQNVFNKELTNGSKLYLRYALHDAEKLRGNSIDKLYFDETQSLRSDVIDITTEVMNRSEYKKVVYGGTPLRTKGTLANIWHKSTMNEYAIKCGACGHWNILDDNNIGKTGLICSKCGSYDMHLGQGQWVSSFSFSNKAPSIVGFRVCALHFSKAPWVKWSRDIIHKLENRPKQIFFNETLALEYDGGTVPITRQQLYDISSPSRMNDKPDKYEAGYTNFSGIDYGPESSDNSNTVLVNIQRRPSYYLVTYAKKFLGKEGSFTYIHDEVPKIMSTWNSMFLAADYGMGEASNAEIRKRIGENKLIAFQHVNSQKEKMRFNQKLNAYTLNRTECMSLIFNALKSGVIRFKSPIDMDIFFDDILNIYAEYDDELGSMRYVNSGPDDFFHALLYVILASDAYEGETMLNV